MTGMTYDWFICGALDNQVLAPECLLMIQYSFILLSSLSHAGKPRHHNEACITKPLVF